jgi:tRNA A-37 threonylcarbamoyl transferase component Bud32
MCGPGGDDDHALRLHSWVRVRCGGRWWQVRTDLAGDALFLEHLREPDRLLEPPGVPLRPIHPRWARAIVRIELPDWRGPPLIVKRYRPKSVWTFLKDLVRGTQVLRTLQRTRQLAALGVPVAGIVAAQSHRWTAWCESWLIMEEVPVAQSLWNRYAKSRDALDRRPHLVLLARLMAQLHDHGFEHNDPGLSNFMVSFANPARPAMVLIDLDGLNQRQQSLRRVAKGLRRLGRMARLPPHSECLRFLVTYVDARKLPIDARVLARMIGPLKP